MLPKLERQADEAAGGEGVDDTMAAGQAAAEALELPELGALAACVKT